MKGIKENKPPYFYISLGALTSISSQLFEGFVRYLLFVVAISFTIYGFVVYFKKD